MGAGASVTDVKGMDSSALSATVKGMGPAYEGYGAAIEENQITGDFIASMSPDEFKETLGELGVTKLHQKILSHLWTDGDKVTHGQAGEVKGGASDGDPNFVAVMFPGNKGNVICYLTSLRRTRSARRRGSRRRRPRSPRR